MRNMEVCGGYYYNGIEFEIGTVNTFSVLPKGSSMWYRMNNMDVYKSALQMNKNDTIYNIPAWFILKCFREFASEEKLDRFLN